MASAQASKGSSDRTTPDLCTPSHPCAQVPVQQQAHAHTEQQSEEQAKFGYLPGAYINGSGGGYQETAFDELQPSQLAQQITSAQQQQQQQQYEGPRKVVPTAPIERQMTDAEKLKADKEQLKLNLQNFRKTQKTAKQLQLAKQAAALQAQKSSNVGAINSTYQAFDLQNYKSPMDCFVGLQSAKRMIQQPVFQGTMASIPQQQQQQQNQSSYQNETGATGGISSISYGQSTKLGQQPSTVVHGIRHSQVVHHPPPPQARRKRAHDLKENEIMQPHRSNEDAIQLSKQLQPHSSRRLGRFVPQALNHISNQHAGFNQNLHPNLTGKMPYLQQQKEVNQLNRNLDRIATQGAPNQSPFKNSIKANAVQQQPQPQQRVTASQQQTQQFNSLSAQLDKIVNCLNYDQGEICQLFKQKYQELMLEHDHATRQQNLQVPAQEPNLSLLLQLVQNDLLARQQKQAAITAEQNNQAQYENQLQHQVSNPSQTSEQHSVSSTVAVINHDEEEEDEVDGDQVMISDDDEDDEGREYVDEDDEESASSGGLYTHQSVNCFPGDQTEAYEQQLGEPDHQQLHGCIDQQYHQFSQSDYVEAVEGFSPDQDNEDDEQICYDDEDDQDHHHNGIDREQQPDDEACYDESQATEEEELDHNSQYIEEEHQFALNELYSQAHKQMLASGQGTSKEELRAWQAVYPRLFGGAGLTPQNLEQIISLGQANLTPEQAQEIINLEGLAQHQQQQNQSQQQQHEIMVDQEDAQQDPNQYDWCSQDSDEEESNYEGEVDDSANNSLNQVTYSNDIGSDGTYQEQQNLIHSTLKPPSHLSLSFQRFFSEFENNIDFILRYDYDILPQQRTPNVCKAELKRLKIKYENLLTASRDMCRRFTGPHSVLQIFIEKIVASINSIAESMKESTLHELGLWYEVQIPLSSAQQQLLQQRKQLSSSVLTHKRSSSANPELLITKTSKTSTADDSSTAQETSSKQEPEPTSVAARPLVLRPKPLLECIEKYTQFLSDLRDQYLLIMQDCAPNISKHFTKLTAVIVENTQYEFPSIEIHKAVISKLIINDTKYFKNLVLHIQKEFQQQEELIRENYPDFVNALELFLSEVDQDMKANQTKIDIYMRDLRKHALDEYEDLYRDEQELIKQGRNAEGKKKRRKNRRKNKNAAMEQDSNTAQSPAAANNITDAENVRKAQNQSQKQVANSEQAQNMDEAEDANGLEEPIDQDEASGQATAGVGGKKKKRNRRNKKKAQDSLTNELLNNLDTDDLVDFINNGCSKKEDLKKGSNAKDSGIAASANSSAQPPGSKYSTIANNTNEESGRHGSDPQQVADDTAKTNSSTQSPQEQAAGDNAGADDAKTEVEGQETIKCASKNYRSKRKRTKLRAQREEQAQKDAGEAEANMAKSNATIDEAQQFQKKKTTNELGEEVDGVGSAGGGCFAEDATGSEVAFEELFESYQYHMLSNCLNLAQKMKPNVSAGWLKSKRRQLTMLDQQQAQRSRSSTSHSQ